MSGKVNDHFPEFCLTFSPNWYLPQILTVDHVSQRLAYGVNNSVFLMDYVQKRPITVFLCEETLNPKEKNPADKKSKVIDSKVTSVLLHRNYLVCGFESGVLSIWNLDSKENHMPLFIKKYEFSNDILFLLGERSGESERILCFDSKGTCFIVTFNEKTVLNEELRKTTNLDKQDPKVKLTCLKVIFGEYLIFAFRSGMIEIWPRSFEFLVTKIDLQKKILHFDCLPSNENNQQLLHFICVTKEKSKQTLLSSFFSKSDLDFLSASIRKSKQSNQALEEEKGGPSGESLSLATIRYELTLDFHLTESYIKSKDDLKLASVCTKFLTPQEILVSGKMGEIYLLNKNVFEKKGKIKFSPYSAQSETSENSYYTVPDNPHFKSVFEVFMLGARKETDPEILISVGLDRKIGFWSYLRSDIENTFKLDWKINALGGKVKAITHSEKERNLIIFGGCDHSMKLWNLEKKNNRFFTIELWRKLQSCEFNSIKVSKTDQEVVYILDGLNQILIYNAYSQELMLSFKSILTIYNFCEIKADYLALFESAYPKVDNFTKNFKVEVKTHSLKKEAAEKKSSVLMIFAKNNDDNDNKNSIYYFIFLHLNKASLELFQVKLNDITSMSFKDLNYENNEGLMIAYGDYHGSIVLSLYSLGPSDEIEKSEKQLNLTQKIEKVHNYKINSIQFSILEKDLKLLLASGSNDRKVVISVVCLGSVQKEGVLKIQTLYKFVHKAQITSLSWSISSKRLLCLGLNHHSVQVWDFSGSEEQNLEKKQHEYELCNIRGHSGYMVCADFYAENDNFVVTASDDQTIKVWDVRKIQNKRPPNKKKNKNKEKFKN